MILLNINSLIHLSLYHPLSNHPPDLTPAHYTRASINGSVIHVR